MRRGGVASGVSGLAALIFALTGAANAAGTQAWLVVQAFPLAGFQYHAGRAVWDSLRVGDTLDLVREPDNAHDARAVRVEWRGHKLGYVPQRENADVARLLDRGLPLSARIERLAVTPDPWSRLRFVVVLPLPRESAP